MVAQVAKDFKHLLPKNMFIDEISKLDITDYITILACYGHDSIEDTRTSYNELKSKLNSEIADIIFACTNEKRKNKS